MAKLARLPRRDGEALAKREGNWLRATIIGEDGRYSVVDLTIASVPRQPLQHGLPPTPYNRATFQGGEELGYTGYPVYDGLATA